MFECFLHARAFALSNIIRSLFSTDRFNVSRKLCRIRSFWSDLDQVVPTFWSLRYTTTKGERVTEITRCPLNSRTIYICMKILAHSIFSALWAIIPSVAYSTDLRTVIRYSFVDTWWVPLRNSSHCEPLPLLVAWRNGIIFSSCSDRTSETYTEYDIYCPNKEQMLWKRAYCHPISEYHPGKTRAERILPTNKSLFTRFRRFVKREWEKDRSAPSLTIHECKWSKPVQELCTIVGNVPEKSKSSHRHKTLRAPS